MDSYFWNSRAWDVLKRVLIWVSLIVAGLFIAWVLYQAVTQTNARLLHDYIASCQLIVPAATAEQCMALSRLGSAS